MRRRVFTLAVLSLAFATLAGDAASAQRSAPRWVATWATALVARPSQPLAAPAPAAQAAPAAAPLGFDNQTLRQIVRISLGGERFRVVLSNTFGTTPLQVGAARAALRQKDAAIVAQSARPLTFSGRTAVAIPPGAVMVSDPVDMAVMPFSDVAIDVYLPGDTGAGPSPLTSHAGALQTSYVSTNGNHAGAAEFPVLTTTTSWFFLARVEVAAPAAAAAGAIVAFGDSITDGSRSSPDTNNRWTDHLARRLRVGNAQLAVLNMGIGGNRVLTDGTSPSALARFDRDVLTLPGVTHVVVMEGINDLGRMASADDLIAAHRQIIERARAHGLTIIGATVTPIEDTTFQGYYTPANEAARQALNRWIRMSNMYDGVIDFDAALRDPARPTKLRQQYASSDYIHPNDAGYEAMAAAVPLELFTTRPTAVSGRR